MSELGATAALELASVVARARDEGEVAHAVVDWLHGRDDRQWWVLALVEDTRAEVVAGPNPGRVVALAGEGRHTLPGSALAEHAAGEALLVPVATRFGRWGAVATVDGDEATITTTAEVLAAAIETIQSQAELRDVIDRLEEAQAVAHMGSYDWEIATDVNRWSDELYRIYGFEPQSFNASYDRFQAMVHPDDRDRIQATHQHAYATGDPYHTIERIVRPDGEVRVLDTTGRVIQDAAGNPVRMAGVCIDITDRWESEDRAAQAAGRFRLLVETAPDALLVVSEDQRVTQSNARALEMFATTADVLVGAPVTTVLPDGLPPQAGGGGPQEQRAARALREDGSSFPADVTAGAIEDDDGTVVVFVRDATLRIEEEERRQEVRDARLRRRQALEINDNVLQGLAAVMYTLEQGDHVAATQVAATTLASARRMVDELLAGPGGGGVGPGTLVRERPAPRTGLAEPATTAATARPEPPSAPPAPVRVVVVDDAEDLQMVFTLSLETAGGFSVVGTAGDGQSAIDLCRELQPDLVLLDLSMPVMDGLEALPRLREVAPDATVVVLSGFAATTVASQVLELGAAAYIEKGMPQRELIARLRELVDAPEPAASPTPTPHGASGLDEVDDLLGHLVHELSTPLTAAEGLTATLLERGDQLPSATTGEILLSLQRNVQTLGELMRRVVEARQVAGGEIFTDPEPVDVASIVRETVRDFTGAGGERLVVVVEELPEATARGPAVEADVVHVRQIVTNLFSNALKFSPSGHQVTVTVRATTSGAEVDVADRGSGIPEQLQSDVFERFVRGSAGTPGLGLGLYLARRLARVNGGDVTLVSSGPDGSTFRLSLPTATTRRGAPAEQ